MTAKKIVLTLLTVVLLLLTATGCRRIEEGSSLAEEISSAKEILIYEHISDEPIYRADTPDEIALIANLFGDWELDENNVPKDKLLDLGLGISVYVDGTRRILYSEGAGESTNWYGRVDETYCYLPEAFGRFVDAVWRGEIHSPEASTEETTIVYDIYDDHMQPITITFCYSGKEYEPFFNERVAEFNLLSEETLVTIEPVCVETYAELKDILTPTSVEPVNSLPGIVLFDLHDAVNYYEYGAFVDVSEMLVKNGYDTSDILDGVMAQITIDNAIVGAPFGAEANVYYYNRTVLEKHGLADFPETWEELKTWSKAVYEATGLPAITFTQSGEQAVYDLVRNFGGSLTEADDPLKTGLDEDNVIMRLKELGELVKAGYIAWSEESLDPEAWKNGEVICFSGSTVDYLNYLEELALLPEEKRFELGLAWNVSEQRALATVGGSVLAVPDGNDKWAKQGAAIFITWLSAPENQASYARYSGSLMVHKSSIGSDVMLNLTCSDAPELVGIYEKLPENYMAREQIIYYEVVVDQLCDALNKIYIDGNDFDQTYQAMIDEAEYILAGN